MIIMKANRLKIEEVLTKGVESIHPGKSFLERQLLSGRKLKIYCGYDPSSPHLHLGHLVSFLKLSQFQKLGHSVIMLIGDFTGMIGDPTGKESARKKLTRKEVVLNACNYQKLAGRVLAFYGKNPCQLVYNSKWQDKLTFVDIIELASNFTVQQMIARDMFQERLKKKSPIYLQEFLYPLAQAYDSVALDVDAEVGGNDQTFNMFCGRDLMAALKKKEKLIVALKLLADPATGKKMGKTEGNLIPLDMPPKEMYGKIMSWPDGLIQLGFELCTGLPLKEIESIQRAVKSGSLSPRDAKAKLAFNIVSVCHGRKPALEAGKEFTRVFKEKKIPAQIPAIKIKKRIIGLTDLLVETMLAPSRSEAQRIIIQKGCKIDGEIQEDWRKEIQIKKGQILQVGKRRFVKII